MKFNHGTKGCIVRRVNTISSGIVGVLASPCSGGQRCQLLLNKVVDMEASSYTSTTDSETASCFSNGLKWRNLRS